MNTSTIDRSSCTASRHGTKADYHRPGDPCRCPDAVEAERLYRKHLKYGHRPVRSVNAIGSARRLQALAVIGWSIDDLHLELGLTRSVIAVIRRGERVTVHRRTYQLIVATYERLSAADRTGNPETRRRARRAGWVPPLAWEGVDIDDPDARPVVETAPEPGRRSVAVLVEDWDFLVSSGMSEEQAAKRLGIKPESIGQARRRVKVSAARRAQIARKQAAA